MRLLFLCSLPILVYSVTNATYNSFIRQIGFCRMQSFDTISRQTSNSVPMFMDGRVLTGVGLSEQNILSLDGANPCGMCLEIQKAQNLLIDNGVPTLPFTAMVFDQCTDPVCTLDFIDFDIYTPTQPVEQGNPYGIEWSVIPCPVAPTEKWEYILCTNVSCHEHDLEFRKVKEIIKEPVYYWSLTLRNTRLVINSVNVWYSGVMYGLRLENGWVWDFGAYDLYDGIHLLIDGVYEEQLIVEPEEDTLPGYRGGILIHSIHQN